MPAILKIAISPYLSEKLWYFHKILYTAADFELGERHVIKNENFLNSRWRMMYDDKCDDDDDDDDNLDVLLTMTF